MACYWNYHIKRSDKVHYHSLDIPLYFNLPNEHDPVPLEILINRETYLKHLFTEDEMRRFNCEGKMHIFCNILPSTLIYYKKECLMSINEPAISKIEMETIKKYCPKLTITTELFNLSRHGQACLLLWDTLWWRSFVRWMKSEDALFPPTSYLLIIVPWLTVLCPKMSLKERTLCNQVKKSSIQISIDNLIFLGCLTVLGSCSRNFHN